MFDSRSKKSFSLMSWNAFKVDHKKPEVYTEYDIDVFCFQEVVNHEKSCFPIESFEVDFASNIIMKNRNYGVATVSRFSTIKSVKVLTTHKESVINTHKASLISHLDIDGQKVVIVNIHAINFKSNKVYEYEFEKIKELIDLAEKKYPILIVGDFNTWNRTRVKLVKDFCREFGFKIAFLDEPELVKSFQKNHLDFILYRGLHLEKAKVLNCQKISDHNPIIVDFKLS